jgi:phage tail sheath gpL-like
MSDITLTGIGPNAPPGIYGQVLFAQGSGSQSTSVYDTLILANMGSLGTATPGTLYGPDTTVTLQSTSDAAQLFQDGYAASRMWAKYNSVNTVNRVYVMPVPMATGTQATWTLTITTPGPQTTGLINVIIGLTQVGTVFASTDTPTQIATNIVNNVNAVTSLNVVASNVAGVITFTAKGIGARGNWIRISAQVVNGTGVLVNASTYTGRQSFTGGTGSDNAGYTTCINNLVSAGLRFYTVVVEAGADSVDTTQIQNLQANLIDFLAQPVNGERECMIAGSVDTLAHTIAGSSEVTNDARLESINCFHLDVVPGEFAAAWAAAKNYFQTPPLNAGGVNFDNFGATPTTQAFWNIPAPLDGTAPSQTDINTAVVSGVTILKVLKGGRTKVVKSVTNEYWVGTTSQFDPRIVDSGKVTICDYFLDDCESSIALRCNNKLIGNDPPTGTVSSPGVVTPSKVKSIILEVIETYASAGLIDGTSTAAGLVVQRGANPSSRMEVQIPLYTADPLHTVVLLVLQVS